LLFDRLAPRLSLRAQPGTSTPFRAEPVILGLKVGPDCSNEMPNGGANNDM
jgi:hypothetical protein